VHAARAREDPGRKRPDHLRRDGHFSFSSGLLLEKGGWQMLNYLALPFVTAVAIAVLWLLARHRVAAGA